MSLYRTHKISKLLQISSTITLKIVLNTKFIVLLLPNLYNPENGFQKKCSSSTTSLRMFRSRRKQSNGNIYLLDSTRNLPGSTSGPSRNADRGGWTIATQNSTNSSGPKKKTMPCFRRSFLTASSGRALRRSSKLSEQNTWSRIDIMHWFKSKRTIALSFLYLN